MVSPCMRRDPSFGRASSPAFRWRWSSPRSLSLRQAPGSIFDGAAVRLGDCMGDRAALHHCQHGLLEIRLGVRDVGGIGSRDAVDAAHVLQRAILVDDEHVGRGLRAIQSAESSLRIQQYCGRGGAARFGERIRGGSVDVALFAGGGGSGAARGGGCRWTASWWGGRKKDGKTHPPFFFGPSAWMLCMLPLV